MVQAPATYHTGTWLLWAGTAALAAGVIRNPFYLVIVLLATRLVDAAGAAAESRVGTPDPRRQGWGAFLRLGLIILPFTILFNFLAAHVGTHVLVRLPADWPLIGGPLTLEGLVYGLLNGLTLITLIAVFGTFNAGVDTYALLRGIPSGFAQAGVVTAIALAYIPQTLTRLSEIREAQTLRGHRVRGARDLVPLAVPLLAGGLERAIALAEAMEARGFAPQPVAGDRETPRRGARWVAALLVAGAGALLLGGAFSAYFREQPAWGWLFLGLGGVLLGGAIARLNQGTTRTRYRRETWRAHDAAVCAVLLAGAGAIVGAGLALPGAWAYTPYPSLTWPSFHPLLGLALLALAAPAVPLIAMSDER
jgi:energy-coupling factor transport system permease protein